MHLHYLQLLDIFLRLQSMSDFIRSMLPEPSKPSRKEFLRAAQNVWPIGLIFTLVFGGIYGGIFTPTEGASIGTALTFLIATARRCNTEL
jgi:TRAP-type C4-dicarboxylate transport system permease large subunit